jgi:hypothetical protein
MPPPVTLAATYLVINLAISVWLVREETHGREVSPWVKTATRTLRYGPPLLGVFYLVTIADDWPFFLFVVAFFGSAFWLMIGLLNFPSGKSKE